MSIRILQIGAGIRGRHWAQFVAAYPDAECVALVEPDAEARAKAMSIIGDGGKCRPYAGIDEALGEISADAALIVSPSVMHAEMTLRCLDAGLTVLVEKPLVRTIDEGRRVLHRARATGKQVIVAENYRYWPAERTVRRMLQEGFLGAIDNATMTDRRNQPSRTEAPWFRSVEYPQLREIAIHHFDSMRAFFGSHPKEIAVRVWNPPWTDYDHGANTDALVDFGAVRVQYLGTLQSHRFGFSLWIEGERGVLWTNRKFVAWRPKGKRLFRPIRNDKVPKGDEKPYPQGGTTSLLNSLRDAVRHGTPGETRADDNIWTVAMVEAGMLSDRERRTVSLAEVLPEGGGEGAERPD